MVNGDEKQTEKLKKRIVFLQELERLKQVTRSAWTSSGRQESTAEHSWRLALFAGLMMDDFPELDGRRVLLLALIHDVGELYTGDIPAVERPDPDQKYRQELEAAQKVFSLLGEPQQSALMALWHEYETGASPEARLVKALDKAETIIQHNQGKNPPDFDYAFNLGYGRKYFQEQSILAELRVLIDSDTKRHLKRQ